MEPLYLIFLIGLWAVPLLIAWRLMRAHERLADAVTAIATKYRGVIGKAPESFKLPGDAEEPQP